MGSIHFLNLDYLFLWIYRFFSSFNPIALLQGLVNILAPLRPLGFIFMLLLLIIIIYCTFRFWKLEKEQKELFNAQAEAPEAAQGGREINQKWLKVQEHISSQNPSDWRQAILECDIMLSDVLTGLGYQGNTIGDQLKSVNPTNMLTLNAAWEAHKVRNQIAHDGSDFQLNEREAKQTVDLYGKVFKEFNYI